MPYTINEYKFQRYMWQESTTNMEFIGILIIENVYEVWKIWNLTWCHYVMLVCRGKKVRMFNNFFDAHPLDIEQPTRNDCGFASECTKFEANWHSLLSFDLEFLSTLNIHHRIVHVKIWHFSELIAIFESLTTFLII